MLGICISVLHNHKYKSWQLDQVIHQVLLIGSPVTYNGLYSIYGMKFPAYHPAYALIESEFVAVSVLGILLISLIFTHLLETVHCSAMDVPTPRPLTSYPAGVLCQRHYSHRIDRQSFTCTRPPVLLSARPHPFPPEVPEMSCLYSPRYQEVLIREFPVLNVGLITDGG